MSDASAGAAKPRFLWLRRLPVVEVLLLVIGAMVALTLDDWREAGERAERPAPFLGLRSGARAPR